MKDEKITRVEIVVTGEDRDARSLIAQQVAAWLRAGGFQTGLSDPEPALAYVRLPDVARTTIVAVRALKPPEPVLDPAKGGSMVVEPPCELPKKE